MVAWCHKAKPGYISLGDDHCARREADTAAGAEPDEDGVRHPGVVHQLDHLVQQDPGWGDSHAVGYREDRANLVHGVAANTRFSEEES